MGVTLNLTFSLTGTCDWLRLDVTGYDWHYAGMDEPDLAEVAEQVQAARLALNLSKEAAARLAEVSTITYKRIEDGLPVRDTSMVQVQRALGLSVDATVHAPAATAGAAQVAQALQDVERRLQDIHAELASLRAEYDIVEGTGRTVKRSPSHD